MNKRYCYTTPIFYPSGRPHIGHITTWIYVDIQARRIIKHTGNAATVISGLDVHGTKIRQAAEKNCIEIQDYINQMNDLWYKFFTFVTLQKYHSGVEYIWSTTERISHKQKVINIWNDLYHKKHIYKAEYAGYYHIENEEYVPERTIGDYEKTELLFVKEDHYFINIDFSVGLSSVNQKYFNLLKNISLSMPKKLCISRNEPNGIPVPGSDSSIYVWFDALWYYYTTISEKYNWEDIDVTHVIGSDISKFHILFLNFFYSLYSIKLPFYTITGLLLSKDRKIGKRFGDTFWAIKIDALRLFVYDSNIQEDRLCNGEVMTKYNNIYFNIVCNTVSRLIGITLKDKCLRLNDKRLIKVRNVFRQYIFSNVDHILKPFNICNKLIERFKLWKYPNLSCLVLKDLIKYIHWHDYIFVELSAILKQLDHHTNIDTKIYDRTSCLSDMDQW